MKEIYELQTGNSILLTVYGIYILSDFKVQKFANLQANLVEIRVQKGHFRFETQCPIYTVPG